MGKEISNFIIIRSVAYIVFGLLALIWPGITLATLAVATAIWLLVAGVIGVFTSVANRDEYQHWVVRLLLSVLQIGVGAYLVQRPAITITTYMLIIGLAFMVEGVVELVQSFMVKGMDAGMMLLTIIGGILSIIAGVIIWRYPVSGSLSFVWVVGLIALINGTMGLVLAGDQKKAK